jgi:hypothetical protein
METVIECQVCGESEFVSGQLQSAAFRPDDVKFMTLLPQSAIAARLCVGCGAILLFADPEHVQSLLKKR